MEPEQVIYTLECINGFLFDNNSNQAEFQELLAKLGTILTISNGDELYRKSLALNNDVWDILSSMLTKELQKSEEPQLTNSLRLWRGILLLIRNLSTGSSNASVGAILSNLKNFNLLHLTGHSNYDNILLAYLQLLSNASRANKVDVKLESIRTAFFGEIPLLDHILQVDEMELPFYLFINEAFKTPEIVYDLLSDSVNEPFLRLLINKGKELPTLETITNNHTILLNILEKVFAHESFSKYIKTVVYMSDYFTELLKIAQVLISSKNDWNSYETTALLAWIYDLFTQTSKKAISILTSSVFDPEELLAYHSRTIRLLDCIADLGKFNSTIQFLEHYNAIVELIALLGAIHNNVERKTIKTRQSTLNESQEARKQFPEVKSLIIEIIAYLTHDSPKMQDTVRELHGLELILSNCMLDDNEPYIKERAIVCLKFLLKQNQKNQDFVAQLEAKQTVDDSVLNEVGYEVKIEDGNVKLKPSEQIKAMTEKLGDN